MAVVGHLKAMLSLDSASYTEGMKKARADARNVSEGMAQLGGAAKFAGVAMAAGATAAVVGIAAMVKSQIDAADAAGEMAAKYSVSTEAISELDYAAKMSGTTIDAVGAAMLKTQKAAVEAAEGNKDLQKTFAQLGIDVQAFAQMSPDQQLEAMADALQGIENVSQRNAIAMKLMGKSATDLNDMLKDGSDGIREMRDEARSLGLTISDDTAKRAADFNDNLDRLQSTLAGIGMEITNAALPALNRIAESMAEGARQGGVLESALRGVNQLVAELAGVAGDGPSKAMVAAQVKARDLREELEKTEALLNKEEMKNSPAFAMMEKRAEAIRQKLAEANAEIGKVAATESAPAAAAAAPVGVDTSSIDTEARAREQEKLRERFADVQESFYNEEMALQLSLARKLQIVEESEALKDVTDAERNAARTAAWAEYEAGATQITQDAAAKRQQIEQQLADAKSRLNMMVFQSAIGLLQAIPGATKAAAIASIAIQKWNAIQAAKSANLAAAELARASQIVPGDPTSLARGEVARAAVLASGSASIAAITAMSIGGGALEAANVLRSNNSPTASGMVSSAGEQNVVAGSSTATTQQPQTVVQVYVTGNVMSGEFMDQNVMPYMEEYFNRDGVLVKPGTAQYDVLTTRASA